MSLDLDDGILQDFLVEAGEILEQLDEQLVQLERDPRDRELLNAVFRGFHTVKGGAGFLDYAPLVEICHRAEDVFNVLRQGERVIDAALMDVVLRAFDVITNMFSQLREGAEVEHADTSLLAELAMYLDPAESSDSVSMPADGVGSNLVSDETVDQAFDEMVQIAERGEAAVSDDITEEEFEQLLDALHGQGKGPGAAGAPSDRDITEREFEQLLDELHGAGKGPGASKPASDEDISEHEFEQLLDALHGQGKAPGRHEGAAPERATSSSREHARELPAESGSVSQPPARAYAPKAETTVRVDTKRLDDIMNLVGELVLARNRLTSLRDSFENDRVVHAVAALDLVTADLQGAVMKTRMQPIRKVFSRFPRVVRDLARSLGKEVDLQLLGEETDLDKNLVEALADPLVHLVRNAVDHGVEPPDVRDANGKPRRGTIVLAAEQAGDHILLTIKDDGAGMNPDELREMAVRKGVMDRDAAARLNEKECYDLIFLPGASTRTEISDVSGRGVGMDVVKTRITQLNGMVDIDSTQGVGTTLTIKVPLTLAILPTLMVVLGTRKFALPLSVVNEIFELQNSRTNIVDGQTVVHVRGKAPPLFQLREWLLQPDERAVPADNPQVVMTQIGNRSFGMVVDQVIGQEEVVIKPLGELLQGLPGLSGATITGDGNIALILDVPGLLRAYAERR